MAFWKVIRPGLQGNRHWFRNGKLVLLSCCILGVILWGCKKDDPDPEDPYGKIRITFAHQVDGQAVQQDTMVYTNEAGNDYLITEVQYFISDVTLHHSDGRKILIDEWKDIHYVDLDLPETMTWEVFDKLPVGQYEKITFTFGINAEKNKTLMFLNPPERDMFWPVFLGGGYHYLKINGKWRTTENNIYSYNFHLGIGQIYASNVIVVDSITGFVQNYFEVDLPQSSFTLTDGGTVQIPLVMNIANWFRTPHVYNHDIEGGYTMQTQSTMQKIKENGWDVFSVASSKKGG